MGQRMRCLIVASHFVFLAGMAGAVAQPLSPSDQQLLREAHAGRNVGSAATNKKLGDALQLARKLGQENNNDEVRNFIKRGADVDAAGKSSSDRPLITAVKYGNWEAMRLLLEAGADPNVKDWVGDTPLKLVAARKAHDESLEVPTLAAAKFLIAKGADVSAASSDTRTPLHVATGLRFTKMVILLVESGANVNAEATDMGLHGLTPAPRLNYATLPMTSSILMPRRSATWLPYSGSALKK